MVLRTLQDVVVFEMDVTTHVFLVVVVAAILISGVAIVCVMIVETQSVQIITILACILVVDQIKLHMIVKEL